MSNESNREDTRTLSPGELKASDFFPPGEGWNQQGGTAKDESAREREDKDIAVDGGRPH